MSESLQRKYVLIDVDLMKKCEQPDNLKGRLVHSVLTMSSSRVPSSDSFGESALKVVYLAIGNIAKKWTMWTMPIQNWKPALNRFAIEFGVHEVAPLKHRFPA